MNEHTSKVIVAILDVISHMFWPIVVLIVIFKFKIYIEALLSRLGSLKIAGSEWVFQQPTEKDLNNKVNIENDDIIKVGPDGFYSLESIGKIVNTSGLIPDNEQTKEGLLIFQTPNQRTWLVTTETYLFVLLDDKNTQKQNKLIQTYFKKSKTLPLEFRTNSVKFKAENIYWYYSSSLYPTPANLNNAIQNLIDY